MYLQKLKITGYKPFKKPFTAIFNERLTVIVGENGSGKSAIVDAIRLLLNEDEYGRIGVSHSDFNRDINEPSTSDGADKIEIQAVFNDLRSEQQVIFLPWTNDINPDMALLNLSVSNKQDSKGRYKRDIWGNEISSGLFEWELLDTIHCIYLPPLRDALGKLESYKGSRLARLIKNLSPELAPGEKQPIEVEFDKFNKGLLADQTIRKANDSIRKNIQDSVGTIFGQDALIQFSETNFTRIVERLRLLFYPSLTTGDAVSSEMYRELKENSLGLNNILYLATVLAELEGLRESDTFLKILLIEEPEAHLHPQLLSRLIKFITKKSKENNIQVIVTTHSPIVASAVDLDDICVISTETKAQTIDYIPIKECLLQKHTKYYLSRWLDSTKSTLLFAKSVLLVEGITEVLLVPEFAKIIFKELNDQGLLNDELKSIEDFGISLINVNGIYFDYFMQLFSGYRIYNNQEEAFSKEKCAKINIRCAGITDNDPDKDSTPTSVEMAIGTNRLLYMVQQLVENCDNVRLYHNSKTFEYDLAITEDNLKILLPILLETINTNGSIKSTTEEYCKLNWNDEGIDKKAEASKFLLDTIEGGRFTSKGEFAQILAMRLEDGDIELKVPIYIKDAINWLIQDFIKDARS